MSYILGKQRERNISTSGHRDYYQGHRQQVMALLEEASVGRKERLCILGAGNCNDTDLVQLSKWYSELHLVDWDAESLQEGVNRQQPPPGSVTLHSGVELTGVARYIERWKKITPSHQEINDVIALMSEPFDIEIGSSFDVVLSSSLLTQLIELPVALLGLKHPRMVEVAMKIRAAHFRLMVSLMAPGGTGVLVTELISSDNCEELKQCPVDQLPALQDRLIREKKTFTGTNPQALIPALNADPFIAPQIEQARLTAPWRWQLAPTRFFLAYGLVFNKK